MSATAYVVLCGPADQAPETVVGPFETATAAESWAATHEQAGRYAARPGSDPAVAAIDRWEEALRTGPPRQSCSNECSNEVESERGPARPCEI